MTYNKKIENIPKKIMFFAEFGRNGSNLNDAKLLSILKKRNL